MLVRKQHLITGEMNMMDLPVTQDQLDLFQMPGRPNVQEIFPQLNADEREFLITGMLPGEYDGTCDEYTNAQFLTEEDVDPRCVTLGGMHD